MNLTIELAFGPEVRTFPEFLSWYVRDGGLWVITQTDRHFFPLMAVKSVHEVIA